MTEEGKALSFPLSEEESENLAKLTLDLKDSIFKEDFSPLSDRLRERKINLSRN